ncbi:hypothetical protein FM107_13945 [Sphingobacterium sp. JB170]|nr:hypothetical protein FM107_13945 [Sphingobacterium sp. JB170]
MIDKDFGVESLLHNFGGNVQSRNYAGWIGGSTRYFGSGY